MPRPKGSKNKPKAVEAQNVASIESINEKIEQVTAEIEQLTATLKAKKAELKELTKEKAAADKAAAEAKAEKEKEAILAAVKRSGKSMDEILSFLEG